MKIVFQEFTDYPDSNEIIMKDIVLSLMYNGLSDLVSSRLNVLKDEINYQEIEFSEKNPCIVIAFIDYKKYGILSFKGYTKELTIKMKSCFSKSDFDSICDKVDSARRIINN